MTDEKLLKLALNVISCKTLKEAAVKSGISERTLRRIRKTQEYQAILSESRSEVYSRAYDYALSAAPNCVEQLVTISMDKNAPASARVAAARAILDLGQGYLDNREVRDRLTVIENAIGRAYEE